MNATEKQLVAIQQWMQTVITHPGGVIAGAASAEGSESEANGLDSLNKKILPSQALTSVERLEIYRHAYYSRLMECLREFFPALTQAIGPDAFDEFAFGYLQKYPPQTYTLNHLADRFVLFLEETKPADVPADVAADVAGEELDWPDFLIDLAHLEWTIEEVFDTEGNEQGAILSVDSLKTIPPEQWPTARLILNPSLRLLAFRFPVNDYYTAFRREEGAEIPAADKTWLAIHRRDFIVRRHELTLAQYQLLLAIQGGATLGEAIERASESVSTDFGEWGQQLQNSFQIWAKDQFFSGVEWT